VLFFDGIFNDSDWEIIDHEVGSGGFSTGTQMVIGGNPNDFREVTTTTNSGSGERRVFSFNFKDGATYDPQSQGAIGSIDYSEDSVVFSSVQSIAIGLRQDGELYMSSLIGTFSGTGDRQRDGQAGAPMEICVT
jgi:hypothetical protein